MRIKQKVTSVWVGSEYDGGFVQVEDLVTVGVLPHSVVCYVLRVWERHSSATVRRVKNSSGSRGSSVTKKIKQV